jgi:hypothetical protein
MEKMGCFFHTMENFLAVFPHNGKNVSTVWKIQPHSLPIAQLREIAA